MAKGRRIYTASFASTVSTVTKQILRITPNNEVVRLLRIDIAQDNQPDSAAVEMRRVVLVRPSGAGSGGTTLTPHPHQSGIPASGTTAQADFTVSGSGTPIVSQWAMNTLDGLHVRWDEHDAWVMASTQHMTVRLFGGTLSMDFVYSITFEELGD